MGVVRQRWVCGAVLRIPLGGGFHSYAQMLISPEYAFLDWLTGDERPVRAVVARPVLFRLWVNSSAHSQGRWRKVGSAPLSDALAEPVLRFNQDPLRPQDVRVTFDGTDGPLATPAEYEGLECAAVWGPNHVEDRLRDHYAGRAKPWALPFGPRPE